MICGWHPRFEWLHTDWPQFQLESFVKHLNSSLVANETLSAFSLIRWPLGIARGSSTNPLWPLCRPASSLCPVGHALPQSAGVLRWGTSGFRWWRSAERGNVCCWLSSKIRRQRSEVWGKLRGKIEHFLLHFQQLLICFDLKKKKAFLGFEYFGNLRQNDASLEI